MRRRLCRYSLGLLAVLSALAGAAFVSAAQAPAAGAATASPIKHVVVIVMENHSFDNILGKFCAELRSKRITRPGKDMGCDGVTSGTRSNGTVVPLATAPDFVPDASHSVAGQQSAIDGGKMDGFDETDNCTGSDYKNCYAQYNPLSGPCDSSNGSCITNVAALASTYTVSDRTFELSATPSWLGHLEFATASPDGFYGTIPTPPSAFPNAPQPVAVGPGWGCDSGFSTPWGPKNVLVPSCVPNAEGSLGPNWSGYTGVTAPYVPTIFDELDQAGMRWNIYGGDGMPTTKQGFGGNGWAWAICPSFAECLYTGQRNQLVPAANIQTDAANSNLPALSIVTPTVANSQHNDDLMSTGDTWIGQIMSSLMASPEWSSTAVFLTWDDCGCMYDHVNPLQYNSTWGIRIPMIIVSPWAKLGYTDSHPTTFAGILAYVEKTFHLPALSTADASAYNYSGAFCYNPATAGCQPVGDAPVTMTPTASPALTPTQSKLQAASGDDDT